MLSTCFTLNSNHPMHAASLKFQTRLGKLGLGIRTGDNATPCKESRFTAVDQSRTQCYGELTMAARTNPAKRGSVPASIEFLGVSYRFESSREGEAADSRCGVQGCQYIKNAS